ncbi:MAG: hypothetical protein HEP71_08210 [Roseivirga sp.]|nr:hypothetical protein [Roseivirga sp.]
MTKTLDHSNRVDAPYIWSCTDKVSGKSVFWLISEMRRILCCLLCLSAIWSCSAVAPSPQKEDPPGTGDPSTAVEVDSSYLFVGNSLSYYNEMPSILVEIAAAYDLVIGADCLCKPNYAILDHWAETELEALIASKAYVQVILQQGPSSQAFGRSVLLEYGPKISQLASSHQTKTAFYMVWPSKAYYYTFQGVIDNYTEAAKVSDADLFPVGHVWKDYIEETGDESIYGADGFHPSVKGSFLAAWVMFRFLYPDIETEVLPDFSKYISTEDLEKINNLISVTD